MKICLVGAEFSHADERAEVHDEANSSPRKTVILQSINSVSDSPCNYSSRVPKNQTMRLSIKDRLFMYLCLTTHISIVSSSSGWCQQT
jgi:hypothetical protein